MLWAYEKQKGHLRSRCWSIRGGVTATTPFQTSENWSYNDFRRVADWRARDKTCASRARRLYKGMPVWKELSICSVVAIICGVDIDGLAERVEWSRNVRLTQSRQTKTLSELN